MDDTRIKATLKSSFGYSSFRPLQEEIVQTILGGEDVFVLMPTGGGKSLCYQLPALLREGTAVVVSPLIALMKDQVDALLALGVSATYINSSLDPAEISRRQAALQRGEVDLLYVAPERLMMPGFLRLLAQIPISFFAIDEAHCISEWGHDFRPEYRGLGQLRSTFPDVSLGAFTATATERVQKDIKTQLGLEEAASFCGSFNRSNLFYEVWPKQRAYEQVVNYLRGRPGASGIIYCLSRAGTDDLAQRLRIDGYRAGSYHAGLTGEERRGRQEAFIRDDVQIMVATVAFGMGIDKPDVRFVIHYDLPKTLEGYYQESGRAGRDGEPSDCILLYSYGDVAKYQHFIDEKESAAERHIATRQLRQMTDWADSSDCRRRNLLAYFGEDLAGQEGPCCDNCRSPVQREDVTTAAQMFLSCIKRTGERFGATYVIQVLRGSRDQRVLSFGHDRLPTYGIGRDRSDDEWRHLSREMLRAGYLRQDPDQFNALKVTERGRIVLFEGEQVFIAPSRKPASVAPSLADHPHPELFEQLRVLRKRLADERGIPPYVIFHDSTLKHMAALLPTTHGELLRISGVGERKAADYGAPFIQSITAFVQETGAKPGTLPAAAPRQRSRGGLGDTVRNTLSLFAQGHDLMEIARMREISQRTVESHLTEAIEAGESVDLDRVVSAEKREAIQAAFAELGTEYLKPVMERLGNGVTYGELALTRASWNRNGEPARTA